MLATYATDVIIPKAVRELDSYRQGSGVSAAPYAKRLYIKALRCEIVREEKRVKSLFFEGLDGSVCDSHLVYLGQHPRAPLTKLARCSDALINIADRNVLL